MQTNRNYGDFLFQLFSLALSFILVHAIYIGIIRPNANLVLIQQADPNTLPRSIWIVLKDFEQEACFVLMLWAMSIIVHKIITIVRQNRLLNKRLIPLTKGSKVMPSDAASIARSLEQPPLQQYFLARTLSNALQRFAISGKLAEVTTTIRDYCEAENSRLDTELATIRYIAWAIPSVGFIGTVRGIGEALSQAHIALTGDIATVTASLGVAFNSTFIALLLSIILMFFTHQLTLYQERFVLGVQQYCENYLVKYLHH